MRVLAKGPVGRGSLAAWPRSGHRKTAVVVVLLLVAAAIPRLWDLGRLSFYGDEETSAFPARSLAEGRGARMPTGMGYRRALPLTWLNAASAEVFGANEEFSYRLPSAIFGILTVPLLYLIGRGFVGWRPALVGSVLLAGSEWHIAQSRMNRMYAAFVFFFVAAVWLLWTWAASRGGWKRLGVGLVLYAVALSLHLLALAGVAFVILPILLRPRQSRRASWKLVVCGVLMAAGGWLYHDLFVGAPYEAYLWSEPVTDPDPGGVTATADILSSALSWRAVLAILGAGLGAAAAWKGKGADRGGFSGTLSGLGCLVLAASCGALVGLGHLYGAAVAGGLYLMLDPGDLMRRAKQARLALGGIVALTVVSVGIRIEHLGWSEGTRALLAHPFPYPYFMSKQSFVLLILFLVGCLWLAWSGVRREDDGLRACAIVCLFYVGALGFVREWGGTRYYFAVYPLALYVGGMGLLVVFRRGLEFWGRAKGEKTLALAILISASGVVEGHGVPAAFHVATLEHGERVERHYHMGLRFRPDHAGAGRFLDSAANQEDLVIAEDPLEIRWYAGQADYWFRSYRDSRGFLMRSPEGEYRDIYTGSQLLEDPGTIDSLTAHSSERIWFVSSGETQEFRPYYLDDAQRRWLDSVEAALEPAFTGTDSVTRVFCLNCGSGKP